MHATTDKLIALRRIINLPVVRGQARWWRLLLIGLGVSVLLHGVALDLWRGSMGQGSSQISDLRRVPLHAKLQSPVLETRPIDSVFQPEVRSSDVSLGQGRTPASVGDVVASLNVLAESSSLRKKLPQDATTESSAADLGLRPLSMAEGLIAYRLALLAELQPPVGNLPNPLQVVLSLKDEATNLNVMTSSGDGGVDRAWLSALSHAAANVLLPSVLVGQVFSLTLEIEP